MSDTFQIRSLRYDDIRLVTEWSRLEGFAPGKGDVNVYRNTDSQGIWIGTLNNKPIGSIVGVRYNQFYGFIGLYIVKKEYRGNGYGISLWKHALDSMDDIGCIGLEAAPERTNDYARWGFKTSSITTRWKFYSNYDSNYSFNDTKGLILLEESEISEDLIQNYDAKKEETYRPHFLSDWLFHKSGKVIALVDESRNCVGFGRIRPCLLKEGYGWRIGPLIANSPELAETLIKSLLVRHYGYVYIDSPGLNDNVNELFNGIGFTKDSYTVRMYKGTQKKISLEDVYGLACLELG